MSDHLSSTASPGRGARVLVAGVGNVLLRDDGFGVEVVRRLAREPLPEHVRVVDFGIRALHLAYELLEGYETLIIIDAMSRGEAPGTLFVLEPGPDAAHEHAGGAALDPHGLDPGAVLRMALDLGARPRVVRVLGCEPADLDDGLGLSPVVEAAVTAAVHMARALALTRPAGVGSNQEDEHVEHPEKEAP
jgi:hydrogenase maturation protease